jgi:hypothetical protein
MSNEFYIPDLKRWMPGDVVAKAWPLEDQLLEIWTKYLQTIGPSVVRAYREEKLKEQPHVHAFNRVKDKMERIALELLVEEELQQDNQER